jgi:two-component system sensor histidine kinase ResE
VLDQLFEKVDRSFGVLARKKNIDFTVDVDASVPRSIPGDPDRITDQVLGNLLSNALKFTPEGGAVAVRAWSDKDLLRIEVRDSGEGIPREDLPHIFDKFYQVSQQARTKGAGLGLAIALEVVEAHGGTIDVDSQPGRGTTFTINIPLHRAPARSKSKSIAEKTA